MQLFDPAFSDFATYQAGELRIACHDESAPLVTLRICGAKVKEVGEALKKFRMRSGPIDGVAADSKDGPSGRTFHRFHQSATSAT
jgi:hypothetical protein